MCRYNETEDEVLIQRLRAGESMIADYLMEKYKGLVRKKARAMFLIGGDTDDLADRPQAFGGVAAFGEAQR